MKIGDVVIYKKSNDYHPDILRVHLGQRGIVVGFAPYTGYPFVSFNGDKFLINPNYLEEDNDFSRLTQ